MFGGDWLLPFYGKLAECASAFRGPGRSATIAPPEVCVEPLEPRTVSESRVTTSEFVHPQDTNSHGTIFGGRVVSLMDIACAIAAARHCRRPVVTASIDEVHFLNPVKLGQILILCACVNYTARTSMEIGVRVESENPLTGERRHTASAYFTFVALDDLGHPTPVPPVAPETEVEQRRFEEASARRAHRLEVRAATRKREQDRPAPGPSC